MMLLFDFLKTYFLHLAHNLIKRLSCLGHLYESFFNHIHPIVVLGTIPLFYVLYGNVVSGKGNIKDLIGKSQYHWFILGHH